MQGESGGQRESAGRSWKRNDDRQLTLVCLVASVQFYIGRGGEVFTYLPGVISGEIGCGIFGRVKAKLLVDGEGQNDP